MGEIIIRFFNVSDEKMNKFEEAKKRAKGVTPYQGDFKNLEVDCTSIPAQIISEPVNWSLAMLDKLMFDKQKKQN